MSDAGNVLMCHAVRLEGTAMTEATPAEPVKMAEISTPTELGAAIKKLIEQSGVSRRELSRQAGKQVGAVAVPRSSLSEIENGKRLPRRDQLRTILTLLGVTDETELDEWEEARDRLAEQNSRFGTSGVMPGMLPIGDLLESGPMEGALRLLRRSVPEAAAELEKVAPGSAASILKRWPEDISAEILSAMSSEDAAAALLAMRSVRRTRTLLSKMAPAQSARCLRDMGSTHAVRLLGYWSEVMTGEILRELNDDDLVRQVRLRQRALESGQIGVVVLSVGYLIWLGWELTAEFRQSR